MNFFDANLQGMHLICMIVLGIYLACVIILFMQYFQFLNLKMDETPLDTSSQKPISVVIATRNEHEQLRQNLPFFFNQNYANFEVVVVIDDSDKDLAYIMQEFEKQYPNLKTVSFEWSRNFFVSPRFAESIGIKSATYDRILLGNITTRPASPDWIARMSNALSGDKEIVLGYHTAASKASFANALIRFDTFFYALRYLTATVFGRPFTANSKNLAFERSLFYEAQGVAKFYNVNTGDEDMFVNKASTKTNTTIEIHPDAFVKGQLEPSFNDWFECKIRHRVLFKEFKTQNRVRLAGYELSSVLFYCITILAVCCFFLAEPEFSDVVFKLFIAAGVIFLLKLLAQWIMFKRMMKTFGEHGFLLFIPIYDIVMLILQPVLLLSGLFTKRITWK
ncbi:MAG: glycosyltransferase [Bacteroidales bacterium]|jgi:glycosyltransferase involved in cell wall biosynthesis|nr:glycosyltransferase [Bacteroidales bacterium]